MEGKWMGHWQERPGFVLGQALAFPPALHHMLVQMPSGSPGRTSDLPGTTRGYQGLGMASISSILPTVGLIRSDWRWFMVELTLIMAMSWPEIPKWRSLSLGNSYPCLGPWLGPTNPCWIAGSTARMWCDQKNPRSFFWRFRWVEKQCRTSFWPCWVCCLELSWWLRSSCPDLLSIFRSQLADP